MTLKKIKIKLKKMNKFKIFSLALVATTIAKAQDLEPAKKAIDAEQFEKAKSLLKSVIKAKPSNGKAAFLLGTIYLKQNISDSASIYFQKGLLGAEGGKFNNIGLGQIELENGKTTAAQNLFAIVTKDMRKKDFEENIKKIKLTITYPASTGRNFVEVLRVIDSLQLTANYSVATPANWVDGEDVIVVPAVTTEDALVKFPKGLNIVKPYLRYTPQPNK